MQKGSLVISYLAHCDIFEETQSKKIKIETSTKVKAPKVKRFSLGLYCAGVGNIYESLVNLGHVNEVPYFSYEYTSLSRETHIDLSDKNLELMRANPENISKAFCPLTSILMKTMGYCSEAAPVVGNKSFGVTYMSAGLVAYDASGCRLYNFLLL